MPSALMPGVLHEVRHPDDLLDGAPEQPLRSGALSLELAGYGYRWLRIRREGQRATP